MSSTIGKIFSVTTFGESHGSCIGAVIEGCPSGLEIGEQNIELQLARRRPGQGSLCSTRNEPDNVRIVSGVEAGLTLGSPIALIIDNKDKRAADYVDFANIPRPSHADFAYRSRYGISSASGGGRASARETAARVAGGAVAEKYLQDRHGVDIVAWVSAVSNVESADISVDTVTRADVDASEVRCPDLSSAKAMAAMISGVAEAGDSVGGVITCVCRNVPAGWGEPVFDKVDAMLASAVLSIPACKGFEIGSGFSGTCMRGSEHNDMFVMKGSRLGTGTNRSGGVQGGITNGEPVIFRAAFKPVASIRLPQHTVDYDGKSVVLEIKGRHDPCVLPRAVPVVEAMAAIVLADMARRRG